MKPLKGTKARKPKPHSKGGKRAAVAKAARRATPATRGQHSRAEVKRGAAAKAAAEASAAARLGKIRKRPVQSIQGPMRRIEAELPDPLAGAGGAGHPARGGGRHFDLAGAGHRRPPQRGQIHSLQPSHQFPPLDRRR